MPMSHRAIPPAARRWEREADRNRVRAHDDPEQAGDLALIERTALAYPAGQRRIWYGGRRIADEQLPDDRTSEDSCSSLLPRLGVVIFAQPPPERSRPPGKPGLGA